MSKYLREAVMDSKACSKCGEVKSHDLYYNKKSGPLGKASACKDCCKVGWHKLLSRKGDTIRARQRELYSLNVDTRRANDLAYRVRNRDRLTSEYAIYREANKDEINKRSREYYSQWSKTTSGKASITTRRQKRRAIKNETPVHNSVTPSEWAAILKSSSGECSYCCATEVPMELEHVIPLSKGGLNSVCNITVACKSCNCSKSNKLLIDEWTPPKMSDKFLAMFPIYGLHLER